MLWVALVLIILAARMALTAQQIAEPAVAVVEIPLQHQAQAAPVS